MLLQSLMFASAVALVASQQIPEYIRQCNANDPQLVECIKGSIHHLKPWLRTGIPEIQLPSVEPFRMDSLSLALTGGPNGYKINLKEMEVFGASNFTIRSIKLAEGKEPFDAVITIPRLTINAKYTSSGVLIVIPASGGGEFHAVFDGVTANLRGKVSNRQTEKGIFLHVDALNLSLDVKKPRLSVAKIFNNNRILNEATNLFLRENGHEILKAMQPQLQKKLSSEFIGIGNTLLKNVPRNNFLRD